LSEPPRAQGAGPWLAFTACCAVWGSTFLFIRIGNDTVPPVWGAALRLAIAAVLLVLLTLAVKAPWPRGPQLGASVAFGIVDFGISLPLLYWGEAQVPSGLAAVIFATIPLSTALLARAFGLEPLRGRVVFASVVAIAGVALLFSSSLTGGFAPSRLVAVWLAATTAALAGVLLKRAPGAHPFAMNAWAHGIGAVMCAAASLAIGESQAWPTGASWIPIAYLVVFGSIGAFATFAWLLQRWPVTRASFIAVIIPLVALALGIVVRHERPGSAALGGSVLILAAVVTGLAGEARARR
jgi:drug/metabolite transporter (DMT)-like permease